MPKQDIDFEDQTLEQVLTEQGLTVLKAHATLAESLRLCSAVVQSLTASETPFHFEEDSGDLSIFDDENIEYVRCVHQGDDSGTAQSRYAIWTRELPSGSQMQHLFNQLVKVAPFLPRDGE